MAVRRSNVRAVFNRIRKNGYNKAQGQMTRGLPDVVREIHSLVREKMSELEKSDMTGNYINSFGVAVYRNGEFIACATTHDIENDDPITVTLASGERFRAGRTRYDGSVQEHDFKAPEGSMRHILAHEEVVRWLRRYPPRVDKSKQSLGYRIVTVVDYSKLLGGDKVLLQIADSIESRGGIIKEFKFA